MVKPSIAQRQQAMSRRLSLLHNDKRSDVAVFGKISLSVTLSTALYTFYTFYTFFLDKMGYAGLGFINQTLVLYIKPITSPKIFRSPSMTKKNNTVNTDRYIVPAVEQAALILLSLSDSKSSRMSLLEISGELGIHKSKAYTILNTLMKYGLVRRNIEKKGYSLGSRVVSLARKFLDDLNIPALAEPIMKDLSTRSQGNVVLGLIEGNEVFVVAKHESDDGMGTHTMRIGHRLPLTYGSHGKAIAAFLPKEELENLLKNEKLYFHGKHSMFDKEKLMKEMALCRQNHFAEDMGVMKNGVNNIAAPVLGANLIPIGYILLLGLYSKKELREFGPLVAESAKMLSKQLGAKLN